MATEQLNVLKALDVAKTQLYHFKAVVIAGMGFFTDAYDLFCIALVTKLLGRIYYTDPALNEPGHLPANVSAAVNGSLFVLAGTNFLGLLFSLLVPESKGKSLEELSKENVGDDGIEA
ncbi:unnamed protein product [Triticum turgidum subsp. durum]|uniref:Phosphate transporter n=1 Tax=Triticum turgidum subsp. durum TaxID=4567 RepID=A0A9R0SLZ4_TRITD|nr:unnamed protein product [Triticum turgidum subsp. durum]